METPPPTPHLGERMRATVLTAVATAIMTPVLSLSQASAAGDVDLTASRVYVLVGKTGLGHDHAVSGSLAAGSIRLGARESAGRLVFDLRSFRADGDEARQLLGLEGRTDPDTRRQVDENMLGAAVLDVEKHPTATFDVNAAVPAGRSANGKPLYDLTGTFTLHGVGRPINVRAEAEVVGNVTRLWGGFSIKQTDFGMKPFSKFGGVVGVADELRIYGDIRVVGEPLPAVGSVPPGVAGPAR